MQDLEEARQSHNMHDHGKGNHRRADKQVTCEHLVFPLGSS